MASLCSLMLPRHRYYYKQAMYIGHNSDSYMELFTMTILYQCYTFIYTVVILYLYYAILHYIQGISAVENIVGKPHIVNHNAIPAACFTHPEIAFVGLSEEQCKAKAAKEGFTVYIYTITTSTYLLLLLLLLWCRCWSCILKSRYLQQMCISVFDVLYMYVIYICIYTTICLYLLLIYTLYIYTHIQLGKASGHFRANSKALAENEGDGIAKVSQ